MQLARTDLIRIRLQVSPVVIAFLCQKCGWTLHDSSTQRQEILTADVAKYVPSFQQNVSSDILCTDAENTPQVPQSRTHSAAFFLRVVQNDWWCSEYVWLYWVLAGLKGAPPTAARILRDICISSYFSHLTDEDEWLAMNFCRSDQNGKKSSQGQFLGSCGEVLESKGRQVHPSWSSWCLQNWVKC